MAKAEFNILIVDDDPIMLDAFEICLKSDLPSHAHIVRASDGAQALRKIANQVFDLIITDNNMPSIEGLDFVKILRDDLTKSDINCKTPIILISGALQDFHVTSAKALGISSVLAKPLDPIRLKKAVKSALQL